MLNLKDKRVKRRKKVFGKAQFDPQEGVLWAAMDFEWTCRRAILALSKKPTVILYEKFIDGYASFGGLEKAREVEVLPAIKGACSLPNLVSRVVQWGCVRDAMRCRNAVIHGTENRVTDKECRWSVCVLEDACDAVASFVEEHGGNIFESINRRRSQKAIAKESSGGKTLKAWHDRVDEQIAKYEESHWIRTGMIC